MPICLVIGCGRATHLIHSSESPSNYITHSHPSKEEGWYTMDIDEMMFPDIIGDITEIGFASGVAERFKLVIAENVPGILFDDNNRVNTCNNIDVLLVPKGGFLYRAGGAFTEGGLTPANVIRDQVVALMTGPMGYEHKGKRPINYNMKHETYTGIEENIPDMEEIPVGRIHEFVHVETSQDNVDLEYDLFQKPGA